MSKLINIYCDESCHLPNDKAKAMVLGAIYCDSTECRRVIEKIRSIKLKHKLAKTFEIKWTKVSPSKLKFYEELIEFFFMERALRFRSVLIPDKSALDHDKFSQTHDEWYYKMYYVLIKWLINPQNKYRIYIDIKDTKGSQKVVHLKNYLANNIFDYDHECVISVQQIRSDESEILQVADLLIGAISHANNEATHRSGAKRTLIDKIVNRLPRNTLSESSPYGDIKFNLFPWKAQR